ncbi:MAG: YceI family protein [Micrococcales bacterium]|nr:YceI family protein [Micrococcales bacterium]
MDSTPSSHTPLPTGMTPGTWDLDTAHTEASFTARHAGITKVRGTVAVTGGALTLGDDLESSALSATLDPTTIATGNESRDQHLKSADFFHAEDAPLWTFAATGVTRTGDDTYVITGDLTVNGITRSVDLDTEFGGVARDPWGGTRAGAEASVTLSRKDFGLTWNVALEAGGVLVSDKVAVTLNVEAVQQA